MASDLSKLIQNSFTLTLNGLLAKDAKILQITKTHIKDLEDLQLLKVQSAFDFSNFSSEFSFIVPAKSCSLIFNTMMGSPITELSEEIDDDAEDAIGEFVSNTSGSLTTAINGEELDDIGQTKFNISNKEILQGNDMSDLENMYRFQIDLEDNELIIFVLFDEPILPFITEIASSEITYHEEEKEPEVEEEIIEEVVEKVDDVKKEKKIETKEGKEETSEIKEDTKEKKDVDPKTKKLKLIIIIVGSLLGLVIISFLVMYFMGIFDPEPIIEKKEDTNTTKMIKEPNKVDVVKYTTLKKVIFKTSDINKERLNNKLLELTKYKVLNKEELEAQKLAEKNRLFELEREKELLEFSKNNHEEALFEKQKLDEERIIDKKTKFKKETFSIVKDDVIITNNMPEVVSPKIEKENSPEVEVETLNYVITHSLKYSLFKSLVQETNTNQARISICNNSSGKTTIYIGPFETKDLQNKMIELIQKKNINIDASTENITEVEFNTRCNLE